MPSLQPRDRPEEIEVTLEMKQVGADALERYRGSFADYQLAEAVYIAMRALEHPRRGDRGGKTARAK